MGQSQGRPVVFTDQVQLDHFKLLRVVGKGAFGKVRIVERKDTNLTFALKYLRKDEVVRQENVRNIIRERKMLEHLNHPFLCNLRYSFQDYEYLYLVVDLMNGGDLRFHISRKTFEERAIRFWMAELGCALRYVHSQGIVHRDVKPDNVLLDSEGHVHLADFNVAADYTNPKRPLSSKSGTLAYLAPEVYEEGHYKCEVDWWSLGVVLYECVYGKRPFDARNHEDLSNKIRAASPRYPLTEPRVDTACVSAIQRLMCKRVVDRIGANGFENFTHHPFFYPIDFTALERKQIPPVFVPSSEKTNFDATYDLEELLLEEAPLEARARHQKPRPKLKENASDQERRAAELYEMIEKYFEPFDYTAATFDKVSREEETVVADTRSGMTMSPSQLSGDQQLERIVTDDPVRAATPGGEGGQGSQPPSPPGSPPLTAKVSLPQLVPARSRAPETRSPEPNQPQQVTPSQRPPPAHRSKSVSGTGAGRSSGWTDADTQTINQLPTPRVRGGTRSGSSAVEDSPRSRSKGIVAFLKSGKSRGKSPASAKKYPDGVLGKEGCRVWVKE